MENNLKKYRKIKKYTLQQLGDCVGTSKSYIWELENSKSSPSLRIAYCVSRALGVKLELVFPDDQDYEVEIVCTEIVTKKYKKREFPEITV